MRFVTRLKGPPIAGLRDRRGTAREHLKALPRSTGADGTDQSGQQHITRRTLLTGRDMMLAERARFESSSRGDGGGSWLTPSAHTDVVVDPAGAFPTHRPQRFAHAPVRFFAVPISSPAISVEVVQHHGQ